MQRSQSLSPRFSRYSQDTVSADIIEPSQMASGLLAADLHQSSQPTVVCHSLPVPGLRYRSDAYHPAYPLVTAIPSTVQSAQSLSNPVPHRELQVIPKKNEYDKTHQLNIQQRLQHRIAVAIAKGDQSLVKLLQRELWQAS